MPKGHRSNRSQGYYRLSPVTTPTTATYAPLSSRPTSSSMPNQYYGAPMSSTMSQQSYSTQPQGYPTGGPVQHPLSSTHYSNSLPNSLPPPPLSIRPSSGAWNPTDDQTLMAARAQGMNWAPIQQAYFPSKTPNACRKRHERLMERRSADDWDGLKLENLAKNYMGMRREIWSGLAAQTGEKWNVVEQKVCFSHCQPDLLSIPILIGIFYSACLRASKTSNRQHAALHGANACSTPTQWEAEVRTATPTIPMTAASASTIWRLNMMQTVLVSTRADQIVTIPWAVDMDIRHRHSNVGEAMAIRADCLAWIWGLILLSIDRVLVNCEAMSQIYGFWNGVGAPPQEKRDLQSGNCLYFVELPSFYEHREERGRTRVIVCRFCATFVLLSIRVENSLSFTACWEERRGRLAFVQYVLRGDETRQIAFSASNFELRFSRL